MCVKRHARLACQQLAGEMVHRAVAARAIGDLARLGARLIDQLRHAGDRRGAVDRQHRREGAHQMDMQEVRQCVVRHVLVEHRPDAVRGRTGHHDDVRVAACLGDDVGAQQAAGAGLVLDHDRLAEPRTEPLGKRARQDVGGARRWKVDDPADRLRRPSCSAPMRRTEQWRTPLRQRSGVAVERAWIDEPSINAKQCGATYVPPSMGAEFPMDFDLVLRDVRLVDSKPDQPATDIGVKDGRIAAIAPKLGGNAREDVQGHGRLVCSGFVDTHIHLDKACILGRCEHTTKRNPHLAMERVSAVKHTFTVEDVFERASATIEKCIGHGATRMRPACRSRSQGRPARLRRREGADRQVQVGDRHRDSASCRRRA